MEKLKETVSSPKGRKIIYIICAAILVGWVIFRFAAVASEGAMYVFNATRVAADVGAPIQVVEAVKKDSVLKEPIAIKNNKAYVSSSRVDKFKVGQKVGNGKIISVSENIDLDSGMHVIRTRGVEDGLQYAEFVGDGYLVPAYSVKNGTVLVVEDGKAVSRNVKVIRQDSENALISDGLKDGDKVILSKVNAGDKVQIK